MPPTSVLSIQFLFHVCTPIAVSRSRVTFSIFGVLNVANFCTPPQKKQRPKHSAPMLCQSHRHLPTCNGVNTALKDASYIPLLWRRACPCFANAPAAKKPATPPRHFLPKRARRRSRFLLLDPKRSTIVDMFGFGTSSVMGSPKFPGRQFVPRFQCRT